MIHRIIPTINTTTTTPTQIPALKIPPIASQLLKVVIMANKNAKKIPLLFFILFILLLVNINQFIFMPIHKLKWVNFFKYNVTLFFICIFKTEKQQD